MLNLNLTHLIDDAKCYETLRQMRWESEICYPKCNAKVIRTEGFLEAVAYVPMIRLMLHRLAKNPRQRTLN